MSGTGSSDHVFDIDLPAKPGVEGSNAGGDIAAERAKVIDVLVKLTPKALLVGFRELLGLGDCFVERLGWHAASLPQRT
jgi:hypothetical protein